MQVRVKVQRRRVAAGRSEHHDAPERRGHLQRRGHDLRVAGRIDDDLGQFPVGDFLDERQQIRLRRVGDRRGAELFGHLQALVAQVDADELLSAGRAQDLKGQQAHDARPKDDGALAEHDAADAHAVHGRGAQRVERRLLERDAIRNAHGVTPPGYVERRVPPGRADAVALLQVRHGLAGGQDGSGGGITGPDGILVLARLDLLGDAQHVGQLRARADQRGARLDQHLLVLELGHVELLDLHFTLTGEHGLPGSFGHSGASLPCCVLCPPPAGGRSYSNRADE